MKNLFDCYSRLLIDNHISDIKDSYMRNFSPEKYVRMVKMSGVESAMVYACCHNGNCYYPTRTGHMHKNLDGRDIFGETIGLLRKNGIVPVAYYTATFHNDCAKRFPGSRIIDSSGNSSDQRYHFTCPNQREAVEFYKEQIREIVQYDISGIFLDMSFWPSVCVCDACRKKSGKDFPEVIDWSDPQWVTFQRFREKSMSDFAAELTATAKSCKPGIAVTHQFSPVLGGWYLGQSSGIAEASDYSSGDFYGGNLQQRFGVKAFDAFSRKRPFEFMTSRCVDLHDHTSSKAEEELFLCALTTLANGGAYFFIDAINPDGSLNEKFYRQLQELNCKLEPFKQAVAKHKYTLYAEVGLCFSIECCVERNIDGQKLADLNNGWASNMHVRKNAVLDEALGTAGVLNSMHIPFKIVKKGDDLEKYKVVIINNCAHLTTEECQALRNFAASGGVLIATGATSLYDFYGNTTGNFQLADVFGVDFSGKFSDKINYSGPDHVLAKTPAPLAVPRAGTEVRGFLSMPDFPARDKDCFASIHSDPPGDMTEYPAWTVNDYGKGRCVWIAASVLMLRQYSQQEFCKQIFAEFLPTVLSERCDLHPAAEFTMLKPETGKSRIYAIVNLQNDFPVVPLRNIHFECKAPEDFRRLIRVSDNSEIKFERSGKNISFCIPELGHAEFFLFEADE